MALDCLEVLESFDKFEEKMNKSVENLKNEFNSLKAGRANPHILDKIVVDYYGSPTPIKQIGNITVPEARMLMINVWDKNALKDVEKAIIAANVGITPSNDGNCIRLVFPELTQERRKELCKTIKAVAEECKIVLRNARRDTNDDLKKFKKDNLITEDEQASLEDDVDKALAAKVEEVDKLTKAKEQEVLTV